MNQLIKYFFAIVIITTVYGCEKDEPEVVEVDPRLQVYFDRFVAEGSARGVTVDFDAIPVEGKIEEIVGSGNVSGQCQSNSARANVLLIDTDFWNSTGDIGKEFVIFHELGHCYLDRNHLDTQDSDGVCLSMMHSGTSGCTNSYNGDTRNAFLDELFNP